MISKHTDISGHGDRTTSHYMFTTDQGTFEVDNGVMLGIYNADEIYGKLEIGHYYNITTKGEKVVNWWMQKYPYVISTQEIKSNESSSQR